MNVKCKALTPKIMGTADHYIYFGKTRDYSEINDPVLRSSQRDYDELVNNFMTKLILAASDRDKLNIFVDELTRQHKLKLLSNNKYEFYPLGY